MKRQSGFYWVELVRGKVTIAQWTNVFLPRRGSDGPARARWGGSWMLPAGSYRDTRVRKVLSGRLTPPFKGSIPLPLENVLLEEPGKSYRTALRILKSNHATGTIYVARR